MKKRNAIIAVALAAVITAGGVYGAYHYAGSSGKSVEVVPVSTVNQASGGYYGWGYGMDDSRTGTIVSMSSQNVVLKDDIPLLKVYVEVGDRVKKGDPLIEYDMTMTELQREMQDLQKQMLEINLSSQEKDLEKLKSGQSLSSDYADDPTGTVSVADDLDDVKTMAGESTEEELIGGEAAPETFAGDSDTSGASSGGEASGEIIDDGGDGTSEESGELLEDDDPSTAGGGGSELIIDNHQSTSDDGEVYTEAHTEQETKPQVSEDTQVIEAMGSFVSRAKVLSRESRSEISAEEVVKALKDWSLLSRAVDVNGTAADGSEKTLTGYVLNDKVMKMYEDGVIDQSMVDALYQSYAFVAKANFLYWLNAIVPEGKSLSDVPVETLLGSGTQIEEMMSAWEKCEALARQAEQATKESSSGASNSMGITTNDNGVGAHQILLYLQDMLPASETCELLGTKTDGAYYTLMQQIVDAFNNAETESEPSTDWGGGYDPGGWDDGGWDDGGGSSMTDADRSQAIFDAEQQIKETKLQIREAEIELRKYDRTLANKIVTANMDGVVMNAGSSDAVTMDNSFIVISGAQGMYLRGTINEFELETVQIGDQVSGSSWGSGAFTAEIVEISEYPEQNDNSYFYGGGTGNPNASYYPFLAYIENTDGLTEGDTNYSIAAQSDDGTVAGGIYLESYYVRMDAAGKSYVYIRGTDGLLHKQYVRLGSGTNSWSTEIVGGLSDDDLIAFPYGKNVKEGAKTTQVDELSQLTSYEYLG